MFDLTIKQARARAEKEYLTAVLIKTRGNVTQAAVICGLSKDHMYRLMHKNEVYPVRYRERYKKCSP